MPTAEQIKQFLAGVVLPPLAGAAATWLFVHVHFLALFHITAASVAGELVQLGVWGITTGLGWLTSHNILKGKYTPAAKARVWAMDYILCVSITKTISEQDSSGEWAYYGPGDQAECEAAKATVEAAPTAKGESRTATLVALKPLEEVA